MVHSRAFPMPARLPGDVYTHQKKQRKCVNVCALVKKRDRSLAHFLPQWPPEIFTGKLGKRLASHLPIVTCEILGDGI